MKIQIRLFKPSDVEDIWKLNTEELGYNFPLEESKNKLIVLADSPKDKIYVAIVDNKIVGYAWYLEKQEQKLMSFTNIVDMMAGKDNLILKRYFE